MADVPGKFYRATKVRTGVAPSSAGSIEGEVLPPVNPPGSSLNSVGLTMPSAFTVSNSPLTANGTIGVAGAGTVAQYIRGDGSLADFPESSGGGSSVSYYLNGSVDQGTIGGIAYKELSKVPILGAGTDFTINADGYIASFITDAGDPSLLEIPGGNWNFETYFSASSSGGTPTFYVELYKVSGTTATLIASSSSAPELIAFGTNLTPYFSTLAVPTTTLALTDRLAVRYYVTHSGRTITLHTENNHLCQIITTFTTGLTALNGLTAQVQNFAVGTTGTDFNIASATATHTFNLPTASATNRGALSSSDWSTFNAKQPAGNYVTLDTSQTITGVKTFSQDIMVNAVNVGRGASSVATNTILGFQTLVFNTTGSSNTSVGYSSLYLNTTGSSNSSFGTLALENNIIGSFNTAIGYQALQDNTSSSNTAVGYLASSQNTSGSANFSGGARALENTTTGSVNTSVGFASLQQNTTGGGNVAIGEDAGRYTSVTSVGNTNGNDSVFIGRQSKPLGDSQTNQIVIGHNAIGGGSNTVVIGNSSILSNRFFGTMRIGTINNGVGDYITTDANGVLTKRTGAEVRTDIGAGTVTSVAALTLGTSGTDLSSTVANGTTTPVITLNVPTASATNRGALSAADWTTFNNKQNALTNPVTGTGTTNYLPKFTGSTTIGNSQIFDNGTNVGIGTSSPSSLLHLQNSSGPTLRLVRTSNRFDISADNDFMEINARDASTYMIFKTADTERARITSSGNLLVGTTTDNGARLQVSGAGVAFNFTTSNGLIGNINSSAANGGYVTWQTSGTTIADLGTAQQVFGAGGNDTFGINARGARSLILGTNNTGRLTIASTGAATFSSSVNVGGVSSNTDFRIYRTVAPSVFFSISAPGGTPNTSTLGVNGTDVMVLNASGNVGIGTPSPNRKLEVITGSLTTNGIRLTYAGGVTSEGMDITYLNTGATTTSFDSIYNSDSAVMQFRMKTAGTPVTALYILGSGEAFFNKSVEAYSFVPDGTNPPSSGMYAIAPDGIAFSTNTTNRITILGNGRVGIGLNNPQSLLHINGALSFTEVGFDTVRRHRIESGHSDGSSPNNNLRFLVSDGAGSTAERMRINGSGNVLIGTQTTIGPAAGRIDVLYSGLIQYGMNIRSSHTDGIAISFVNSSGSQVGTIYQNSSSTAYNTSSDYRLKEDLKEFNGIDLINKIKTYDFKWKSDNSRSYGVVAHELQEVINYAVYGQKDSLTMQGVDYSKLVPILIKAIQEQQVQIDKLKN